MKCHATTEALKIRLTALAGLAASISKDVEVRVGGLLLYFRRVVGSQSFWVVAGAATLMLVSILLFVNKWYYPGWLPSVGTVAAGMGVVLPAAAALLPELHAVRVRWILVITGGLFAAWVVYYTATDLTRQILERTDKIVALSQELDTARKAISARDRRVGLLLDAVGRVSRDLPEGDIRIVLTTAGKLLYNQWDSDQKVARHPEDYDPSRDIIGVIKVVDPRLNNGHVLFYSGLIERALGHRENGHQNFYAYITSEPAEADSRTGGSDVLACRTARGYCLERTAWVYNLMANDQYSFTVKRQQRDLSLSRTTLDEEYGQALKYACNAVRFHPPSGFSDPDQAVKTTELIERLNIAMGQPRNQKCPKDDLRE